MTQVGVIDHSKGKCFEENLDCLKKGPWRDKAGLQHKGVSDVVEITQSSVDQSCQSLEFSTLPETLSSPSAERPLLYQPVYAQSQETFRCDGPTSPDVTEPQITSQDEWAWLNQDFMLFDSLENTIVSEF